jgi:hypothetical protein
MDGAISACGFEKRKFREKRQINRGREARELGSFETG